MRFPIIVLVLIAGGCFAQTPNETASIATIVRVNRTGLVGATVTISGSEIRTRDCVTDAYGYCSFDGLAPGRAVLYLKLQSGELKVETVDLKPGRNPNRNFDITESVRVSGKVTGEEKKPVKGASVLLMYSEYVAGAQRYFAATSATSNENGEYVIVAEPRGVFYVLARRTGMMPTYFPGVESIEGAMPLNLPASGKSDLIDIQMKTAPSRCMEGKIETPPGEPPAAYEIGENDPPLWAVAARFAVTPRVPAQEDGKFKICDLHPGNYWIKTYSSAEPAGDHLVDHAIKYVAIGDKDVTGIVTGPAPQFRVDGVVVWDRNSPEDTELDNLNVGIASTTGEFGTTVGISGSLPRGFTLPVWNNGFVVGVQHIPAGAYLKDISYAGHSILNEVFEPGSASAADGLRIVLGRDGAHLSLKAADKDGNAVASANIAVIPASAPSEATAATAMIMGQTDSYGAWSYGPIAPGRYHVVVTASLVNRGVEAFGKLWRALGISDTVELGPNATVQVNRVPQ